MAAFKILALPPSLSLSLMWEHLLMPSRPASWQ